MERMPMVDMVEGDVYRLVSRNLIVGVWRASTRGFIGIRRKFDSLYLFEEYHYEADPHVGTASPVNRIGRVPDGIKLTEGWVEPDPDRPDRKVFVPNQSLFDFLQPIEAAVAATIEAEREQAAIERESKRWAPKTREEAELEERIAEVKAWAEEQRAKGLGFRDFMDEYHQRYRRAIHPEEG